MGCFGPWPSVETTRSRDFRASFRYEVFIGNPSMSGKTLLSFMYLMNGSLGFTTEESVPYKSTNENIPMPSLCMGWMSAADFYLFTSLFI